MKLIHYSDKPLGKLYSVYQSVGGERYEPKPWGLWVSVVGDDDWASWCKSEAFRDTDSQVATEITLAPDANVLHLTGPRELDEFTGKYGFQPYPECPTLWSIRWNEVARDYQGIIIAPYVWERRLDGPASRWYYGWDCASGCIWDVSAIESTVPMEVECASL